MLQHPTEAPPQWIEGARESLKVTVLPHGLTLIADFIRCP
jgi:hypothetical protein